MKNNRKFNPDTYNRQFELEDDYEDFGYEIKNAKRYQSRAKRTAKFKDYDDFEWMSIHSGHLLNCPLISPLASIWCIVYESSGIALWKTFASWLQLVMVVVPFGMSVRIPNALQFKNESTINCVDLTLKKSTFLWSVADMNQEQLLQLKENYCEMILDGMDMDTLMTLAYDLLLDAYQDCSEDDVINEIKDLYDEETLNDLMPVTVWQVSTGGWLSPPSLPYWLQFKQTTSNA